MVFMKFLFTACLFFLTTLSSVAQVLSHRDSIDVTASRITTTISESGKHVTVITQKEIQALPVQSVDDLLRSLSGVNINARQGFGVQADVGIRGSTFSQVLFLLDNTPINDPLTAHYNTNIPVALSEIGQIELIRGPASTSYGADAVGGIVHIKTKTYLRKEVEGGNQLSARSSANLSAGQHNLKTLDATAGISKKNFRFSTSFRTAQSDGEQFSNPAFSQGASQDKTYHSYFEVTNLSAAASLNFADYWSWYVRTGLEKRDFNARYFYTRSIYDASTEQISSRWALSSLTRERGNHRTEISASFRNMDDTFDFNPAISPANKHETNFVYANTSHQYTVDSNRLSALSPSLKHMRFMVGAQLLDKHIESTDRGNHATTSWGVYGIHSMKFDFGLSLTSSLRLQFNPVSELSFLPQISAAYAVGKVVLRSSIGRALREGDFTERYVSHQIPNLTPGRNIGNPDLKPEESTSFDVGLDWSPNSHLFISPTLFYRSSANLIDYALTNANAITNADNLQPNKTYFYASNISESKVYGIEFITALTHKVGAHKILKTEAGYTYIKTNTPGNTTSRYIANHPSHQLHLNLALNMRRVSFHSQSQFNVRSEQAEALINAKVPHQYFLTNLKISYQPFDSGFRIYAEIQNVTDTHYQEILGAPLPGRWILGGVRYSL
jgi:iron complex outermembrane receptor protein